MVKGKVIMDNYSSWDCNSDYIPLILQPMAATCTCGSMWLWIIHTLDSKCSTRSWHCCNGCIKLLQCYPEYCSGVYFHCCYQQSWQWAANNYYDVCIKITMYMYIFELCCIFSLASFPGFSLNLSQKKLGRSLTKLFSPFLVMHHQLVCTATCIILPVLEATGNCILIVSIRFPGKGHHSLVNIILFSSPTYLFTAPSCRAHYSAPAAAIDPTAQWLIMVCILLWWHELLRLVWSWCWISSNSRLLLGELRPISPLFHPVSPLRIFGICNSVSYRWHQTPLSRFK